VIYEYVCEKCQSTREIMRPLSEGPLGEVICDCGGKMHRVWGNSTIHIPEYFKAASGEESPQDIGRRLNRSRPSGRRKVFY
jgi:putative FmdB family regulatory protein